MTSAKLLKRLRIDDPARFRLAAFDGADTCGIDLDKDEAKTMLDGDVKQLAGLQERLYAEHRWAVLIVLQGMDAAGKDIWKDRYKNIRAFERHLACNGVLILNFFLHVSKEEQRRRFLERLDEPAKRWKFNMGDIAERKLWNKYMAAYEDMIRATSLPEAPWYVVPADHKRFARLVVATAIIEGLEGLDLEFPRVEGKALAELQKVRAALVGERSSHGGSAPARRRRKSDGRPSKR